MWAYLCAAAALLRTPPWSCDALLKSQPVAAVASGHIRSCGYPAVTPGHLRSHARTHRVTPARLRSHQLASGPTSCHPRSHRIPPGHIRSGHASGHTIATAFTSDRTRKPTYHFGPQRISRYLTASHGFSQNLTASHRTVYPSHATPPPAGPAAGTGGLPATNPPDYSVKVTGAQRHGTAAPAHDAG